MRVLLILVACAMYWAQRITAAARICLCILHRPDACCAGRKDPRANACCELLCFAFGPEDGATRLSVHWLPCGGHTLSAEHTILPSTYPFFFSPLLSPTRHLQSSECPHLFVEIPRAQTVHISPSKVFWPFPLLWSLLRFLFTFEDLTTASPRGEIALRSDC